MTPEERTHFEELLIKVGQSGKKETSDLVADILNKIDPIIDKSIEKYVNGKIRKLDEKVDAYDKKIDAYIESSSTWRAGTDEQLKPLKDIKGFWSVTGTTFKAIILVGAVTGAITACYKLIKYGIK